MDLLTAIGGYAAIAAALYVVAYVVVGDRDIAGPFALVWPITLPIYLFVMALYLAEIPLEWIGEMLRRKMGR